MSKYREGGDYKTTAKEDLLRANIQDFLERTRNRKKIAIIDLTAGFPRRE